MMLLPVFCRESFCRKAVKALIAAASGCLILSTAPPAQAQQATAVLFQNVRIFDGKSDALSAASSVLVRDNKIEKISSASIPANGAELIDGGGRVLMPGLIDAHWHAMLAGSSPIEAINGDVGYLNLLAAAEAATTTSPRERAAAGAPHATGQSSFVRSGRYPTADSIAESSG
jgi:imidazolonepropionase-like amidohydrolase